LSPREALDPGTAVGGYVVEQLLGHGGMGDVYLARDLALDRQVALKVLPREVATDSRRRGRLQLEGRILQALRHPNICSVYGTGEDNGYAFIAMEYVHGRTLHDLSQGERLPVDRVTSIAIALASALEEARRMGVVHRDLKGTNVMLTPDGQVKVLDFGLAKFAAAAEQRLMNTVRASEPGLVLGTPEYMSPEQALGREVDHRSDLFSLGVVLFELLTGQLPFKARTRMELFWSIVNRQAPSVQSLNAAVPPAMAGVVARLLEKDARHRYETARDVVAALRALHPTRAVRKVARQKVQLQWFRRLAGSTLGILMAWAMMPVAYALSNFAEHAIETNPLLTASVWAGTDKIHDLKTVVDPAINPAAAWISNDGLVVYSTRRRHGRGGLWLAVPGKPSRLLARDAEEAAVGPLGRYVYFTRYGEDPGLFKTRLEPMPGHEPERLASGVIERPVVAADSRLVIFARRAESGFSLWSVAADGHGAAVQLSSTTWDSAPIVSPNLKRMAIAYPKGVLVCDAPACAEQSWVSVSSLVGWTPDGEGLTHAGEPGSSNIWATRIRDGAIRQITRFEDQVVTSISWSPNGRRMTVTRQQILTDLAWFTVLR
jgi:predicted Ser/Thr protein kinase